MNVPSNFDIKVAEQVIDEAIMNNKPHYLIKWKYLPHQFDTWESLENLDHLTHLLQSWVRTKRNTQQIKTLNNVSSYFDTVNYIDPAKKSHKKKKTILKPKKTKLSHKEIVILDEDNDSPNLINKKQSDESFINDTQEPQSFGEKQLITDQSSRDLYQNTQNEKNIQNDLKLETNEESLQPLKFDPEKQVDNRIVEQVGPKLKKGMKVVGKIKSQDIEVLLERFKFQDEWCFKLELKDGRVTNMRQEDLRKLCPQTLMEFYEDHNIKV